MDTEITDFLEIFSDKEYYSGDFENELESSIITLYLGMKFHSWTELENFCINMHCKKVFLIKEQELIII